MGLLRERKPVFTIQTGVKVSKFDCKPDDDGPAIPKGFKSDHARRRASRSAFQIFTLQENVFKVLFSRNTIKLANGNRKWVDINMLFFTKIEEIKEMFFKFPKIPLRFFIKFNLVSLLASRFSMAESSRKRVKDTSRSSLEQKSRLIIGNIILQ